jgi:glycosyltransferase involved in cell wall biosynthesis
VKLFFVTDKQDSHVQRFYSSFETLEGVTAVLVGIEHQTHGPRCVLEGQVVEGWDALRRALGGPSHLVVSGPLDTVTGHLVGGDYRHVGISWATDVMVSAATSPEELANVAETVARLDLVVTDNYATENAVIAFGVTPEKVCRIPWGPAGFNRSGDINRADWGVSDDSLVVLYPRSLEPHYQPEIFIEALAAVVKTHPNTVAVIVESGSLVAALKSDIVARGLEPHVVWQSPVSAASFPSLVAAADVVVVSPLTDGTSVTVMDAMAQGTPVVSSLTNGSAEWVIDGITGWSFPVGNARALAVALSRVWNATPENRATVVANAGRLVAEKAGWARSEAILLREIGKLFSF